MLSASVWTLQHYLLSVQVPSQSATCMEDRITDQIPCTFAVCEILRLITPVSKLSWAILLFELDAAITDLLRLILWNQTSRDCAMFCQVRTTRRDIGAHRVCDVVQLAVAK